MKRSSKISLVVLVVCVASLVLLRGGGLPDLTPADSPFPAEGKWLLLASESADLSGVEVVAGAAVIRDEPDLNARWLDYDARPEGVWGAALTVARDKSGGQPYYVARHGRTAVEGKLAGGVDDMLATVKSALEGM